MNRNKTGWTVTLIAVLAIVCGGLVVKLWPRTVPTQQCSPIYREYAGKPGIRASFVKGYRINDTTFVDATLLKASTNAGFEQLKKDFFYLLTIDEDCNSMGKKKNAWVAYLYRDDHSLPIANHPESGNDMVFYCSDTPLSISIFHVETKQQAAAILDKQLSFFIKNDTTL